jgi:predicted GNAT family acetyltransferase
VSVTHKPEGGGGAFVIEQDGRRLGELTYRLDDGIVTFDHTFVDDELRGQGAGKQLVSAGVAWAREERKQVRASCPYARATIERTPEFRDVLAGDA